MSDDEIKKNHVNEMKKYEYHLNLIHFFFSFSPQACTSDIFQAAFKLSQHYSKRNRKLQS